MSIEKYPLTAEQIREIDELNRDRRANKELLDHAMNYYLNKESQLNKGFKNWWSELASVHGFDPTQPYKVAQVGAKTCIVRDEESEDE